MKLDKNYKVRVTPKQSREIHFLILLEGGEVSYGLKPQLQDEFLVIENEHDSVVIYYTDQDIFPTIENQEIQADDLIALLTDLPKSAENPLENMKLKPEFEAVEPVLADKSVNIQDIDTNILDTNADIKDTPKFKVGDKVYFGTDPDIKTISEVGNDNDVQFAGEFGWASGYSCCHANQENYERLQATFPGIEFEQPPTQEDIDNEAVDKLAQAMKNKLAKKREQGYHGWETCKHGDLVQLLINHVDEGDPIDVANFCAFLFARGEQLTQGGTR